MASSHQTSRLAGIWKETRSIAEKILTDTLVVLILLAAITAVNSLFEQIADSEERKRVFSALHYYTCLIIAAMFLCDVIYAVACFLVRRTRAKVEFKQL